MKRINIIWIWALIGLMSWSCGDSYDEYEVPKTSAYAVSGQWIVDYTYQGDVIVSHARVDIYNSAANDGTAWVDEHDEAVGGFKVKVNTSGNEFTVVNGLDMVNDPDKITIPDGKVIDGDSINFSLIFVYDDGSPSDTIGMAGKLYTGFE